MVTARELKLKWIYLPQVALSFGIRPLILFATQRVLMGRQLPKAHTYCHSVQDPPQALEMRESPLCLSVYPLLLSVNRKDLTHTPYHKTF